MPVIGRRLGALLVSAMLLGGAAGCDRGSKAKAAAPVAPPPTEVIVAPVEQRPVSIVREFTARTEAVPTVEVRARISGVSAAVRSVPYDSARPRMS